MKIKEDNSTNGSSSYFVTKKSSEECNLITVPHEETRLALLANIFMSEGKPGPVRTFSYFCQLNEFKSVHHTLTV